MFINSNFMFDDRDALQEFNIQVVRVDSSGMIEMPFGVKRQIIEEKITLNPTAYYLGVDEQPLTIKITITNANDGKWTSNERREIIRWLFQRQYKPLISEDYPDIAFYVLAQGESSRFDTGLQQGYATIELRTNSPWAYSYPKNILYFSKEVLEKTNNIITLENRSNVCDYCYPEIEFKILDGTSFSIQNLSVGGEVFQFDNLQVNENIYVDNNKRFIKSSLEESQGIYRLKDFNKGWLRLAQGINRLKITGNANVEFRVQYPVAV